MLMPPFREFLSDVSEHPFKRTLIGIARQRIRQEIAPVSPIAFICIGPNKLIEGKTQVVGKLAPSLVHR